MNMLRSMGARSFPLFFGVLITLLTAGACARPELPAKRGVVDLRGASSFLDKSSMRLDGEWEFYPGKFIRGKPGDRKFIVPVPDSWTNYDLDGKKLAPFGFATYRLKILLSNPRDDMVLSGIVSSAHRIYVNGRRVQSVGRIATRAAGFRAHFHNPLSEPFRLEKESLIVVHAANFTFNQGGIIQSLELGPRAPFANQRRNAQWLTLVLIGSILFMAVYHVFLFVLSPRERSALYFVAMCIAVASRMVFVNERVMHDLIPDMNFEIYSRVIYIASYGIFLAAALFVKNLYPGQFSAPVMRFLAGGSIVIMLIVAFFPLEISLRTIPYFGVLIGLGTLYATVMLAREILNGSRGALILLLALVSVCAAGLNDTLHTLHVINTFYCVHYAFAVLILAQSFLVSSRILGQLRTSNQRLLSLDRLKDDFLANTSHELRTPLHGIIGLADSLKTEVPSKLAPDAGRRLDLIIESGRRLAHLVNDILDFSRLRHHDLQLQSVPIDMRPVVRLQLELIRYGNPRAQSIEFHNDIPEGLPPVLGEEGRITQVLNNLLSNAVKYTDQGAIRVSGRMLEKEPPMVEFRVSDTGAGIPLAEKAKIFEPFEQASDASSSRGGTGLGLSIARSLVELHGGELHLEDSTERGSTFAFTLPAASVEAKSSQSPSETNENGMVESLPNILPVHVLAGEKESDTPLDASGAFILLVDDEPVNLEVMRTYTGNTAIQSRSAQNVEQAREILASEALPDCIVLDIMMPGISGLEFTRELRKSYSLTELPILLVTARTQTGDLMAGIEAGANDYLTKPFEKEEFLLRVGSLVAMARNHRDAKRSREAVHGVAQRVRAEINADLHDHLGASLTDLKLLSTAALKDPTIDRTFAEKVDALVTTTTVMMRSDLLTMEDMDLLDRNFAEGIHMLLLRRYVDADREIEFSASGTPMPAPIDDVRGSVLYAVIKEMTTNDLKYGEGPPTWSFHWNESELRVDFQSLSHYRMERHRTGRGTGTMLRRVTEIGGVMEMSMDARDEPRDETGGEKARAIRIAVRVPL